VMRPCPTVIPGRSQGTASNDQPTSLPDPIRIDTLGVTKVPHSDVKVHKPVRTPHRITATEFNELGVCDQSTTASTGTLPPDSFPGHSQAYAADEMRPRSPVLSAGGLASRWRVPKRRCSSILHFRKPTWLWACSLRAPFVVGGEKLLSRMSPVPFPALANYTTRAS
jgi:hypothetical protein